jgi:hypothetical protein
MRSWWSLSAMAISMTAFIDDRSPRSWLSGSWASTWRVLADRRMRRARRVDAARSSGTIEASALPAKVSSAPSCRSARRWWRRPMEVTNSSRCPARAGWAAAAAEAPEDGAGDASSPGSAAARCGASSASIAWPDRRRSIKPPRARPPNRPTATPITAARANSVPPPPQASTAPRPATKPIAAVAPKTDTSIAERPSRATPCSSRLRPLPEGRNLPRAPPEPRATAKGRCIQRAHGKSTAPRPRGRRPGAPP